MADILTSIHGREYGLDANGLPVWNLQDGTQVHMTAAEWAAVRSFVSSAGTAWANLPAASSVPGMIVPISDLATKPLYRSDGTRWRTVGGRALIDHLAAEWVGVANNSLQVVSSITLPAGMWQAGQKLLVEYSLEKLGGTSDTLTPRLKVGGQTLLGPAIGTTAIAAGFINSINRVSATSVRRNGSGANSNTYAGALTGARGTAVTVANLDTNPTVIELSTQMTTGSTEYATVGEYSLYLVG